MTAVIYVLCLSAMLNIDSKTTTCNQFLSVKQLCMCFSAPLASTALRMMHVLVSTSHIQHRQTPLCPVSKSTATCFCACRGVYTPKALPDQDPGGPSCWHCSFFSDDEKRNHIIVADISTNCSSRPVCKWLCGDVNGRGRFTE